MNGTNWQAPPGQVYSIYIPSSYHGRQWPQAQSRLSILQLRKNVLCKCERLSPAHLTSGFKLFCHVGKSLVTQTYVRIAKYICANWMLVHECFLSECVSALVCSITSRTKTENCCFIGCNYGVGVMMFRSNLLSPSSGQMTLPSW